MSSNASTTSPACLYLDRRSSEGTARSMRSVSDSANCEKSPSVSSTSRSGSPAISPRKYAELPLRISRSSSLVNTTYTSAEGLDSVATILEGGTSIPVLERASSTRPTTLSMYASTCETITVDLTGTLPPYLSLSDLSSSADAINPLAGLLPE